MFFKISRPFRGRAATTLRKELSHMLSAGNPFPDFSLPNQDGKIMKLSDFAGHWLVVYFYPKDDTPGCTTQGKSFTAAKSDFDAAGIKSAAAAPATFPPPKNSPQNLPL